MKSQVPVIGGLIDVVAQPVETVTSAAGNFIVDLFNFKGYSIPKFLKLESSAVATDLHDFRGGDCVVEL